MKRVIELQVPRIFVFPDTAELRMMIQIAVKNSNGILIRRRAGHMSGQIAVAVRTVSICQSDQRRIAAPVVAMTGGARRGISFVLLCMMDGTGMASRAFLVAGVRIADKSMRHVFTAERLIRSVADFALVFPGRMHRRHGAA